jgi:hypothetical protein
VREKKINIQMKIETHTKKERMIHRERGRRREKYDTESKTYTAEKGNY